jgi:hypothetical protein
MHTRSLLVVLISIALLEGIVAEVSSFQTFGEIDIFLTNSFREIWSDAGSGSKRDGEFWYPLPYQDARPLGCYLQGNYNAPTATVLLVRPNVAFNFSKTPPLMRPIDFQEIYNDRGSHAKRDGAVWTPVPPAGYVACGLMATLGYNKPSLDSVYVVRQDLARQGTVGDILWSDQGSGGKTDGAFYQINVPLLQTVGDYGKQLIGGDMFFGVNHYGTPSPTAATNVLWLPIHPTITSCDTTPPSLTSREEPAEETLPVLSRSVFIPATCVSDKDRTSDWKMKNSPFYTVQRITTYERELFADNYSNTDQKQSKAVTYGTTREQSTSFQMTTGITVGYEVGVGVGSSKMSASYSLSFAYGSTSSVSEMESTTITRELSIPPKTAGCLWTKKDRISVIRADGTEVAVLGFPAGTSSVVVDQFPKDASRPVVVSEIPN